jgi:aryl carrier-like protein
VPAFMVPTAFVVLERLPRTGGGKVDRQALPSPSATRPTLAAPCVQPRNDPERQIAGIWRDLLRLERVGVDDNFFDLGGHSLLMVRMQMRLREVLRSDVGIVDLFRYPTVASLAAFLAERNELQPTILTDARERMGRQRAVFERRRSTDAGPHRA